MRPIMSNEGILLLLFFFSCSVHGKKDMNSSQLADFKLSLRDAIINLTELTDLIKTKEAIRFNNSLSIARPAYYFAVHNVPEHDGQITTLCRIMELKLMDLKTVIYGMAPKIRHYNDHPSNYNDNASFKKAEGFVHIRGEGWHHLNQLILLYKNWREGSIFDYFIASFGIDSSTLCGYQSNLRRIAHSVDDEFISSYMAKTHYRHSSFQELQNDIMSSVHVMDISRMTYEALTEKSAKVGRLPASCKSLDKIRENLNRFPGRYFNEVIEKGIVIVLKELIDMELSEDSESLSPDQLLNIHSNLQTILRIDYNYSQESYGAVMWLDDCWFTSSAIYSNEPSFASGESNQERSYSQRYSFKNLNVLFHRTIWSNDETQDNRRFMEENSKPLDDLITIEPSGAFMITVSASSAPYLVADIQEAHKFPTVAAFVSESSEERCVFSTGMTSFGKEVQLLVGTRFIERFPKYYDVDVFIGV
uniref:SCP domain-containing protein n=1 Tax=Steinernema glaseri TaxID=37863 RepID=A0A1I8AGQ1_9BILA